MGSGIGLSVLLALRWSRERAFGHGIAVAIFALLGMLTLFNAGKLF